jgi:DNA (cytosine-5)-methyltransferase 1
MGMGGGHTPIHNYQKGAIRRLTPRECFRLMDFPDTFDFSVVSNSQAYKQAGNSIVVNVLCEIIKKLNL